MQSPDKLANAFINATQSEDLDPASRRAFKMAIALVPNFLQSIRESDPSTVDLFLCETAQIVLELRSDDASPMCVAVPHPTTGDLEEVSSDIWPDSDLEGLRRFFSPAPP